MRLSVNVNGSRLERPGRIEASHRVVHNSFYKDAIAEIRPAKIRIVQPGVAAVQAAWQMRGDARRSEPLPARWTGSDRANVKDRIEAAIAAFDEAWNRRDKTALTRRFAAEADFVDTAARWLQRRELMANHIIDVEVPGFGSPTRTSGVKVTMLHPELVVVLVRWTITDTWTHPPT
ncbi:MAG TPA: hypothetical protein VFG86_21295 [Chloroflexota bacterium]|jgi:hypothetical protein|nr:hypothetical protein [Chloroflexota bacterium]